MVKIAQTKIVEIGGSKYLLFPASIYNDKKCSISLDTEELVMKITKKGVEICEYK